VSHHVVGLSACALQHNFRASRVLKLFGSTMTTLDLKSIVSIALSVLLTILLLAGAYYLGARSRSDQDVVPVRDVTSDSVF
jgi:hypothetical protein